MLAIHNKNGKTKTETEKTPYNQLEEALKKAQLEKQRKSTGESYIINSKLKNTSEKLYGEKGNKYLSNPKYGHKKAPALHNKKEPAIKTSKMADEKMQIEPNLNKPKNDKASKIERKSVTKFDREMKNLLGADEYENMKSIRAERKYEKALRTMSKESQVFVRTPVSRIS